jgi:hypothetical protein
VLLLADVPTICSFEAKPRMQLAPSAAQSKAVDVA